MKKLINILLYLILAVSYAKVLFCQDLDVFGGQSLAIGWAMPAETENLSSFKLYIDSINDSSITHQFDIMTWDTLEVNSYEKSDIDFEYNKDSGPSDIVIDLLPGRYDVSMTSVVVSGNITRESAKSVPFTINMCAKVEDDPDTPLIMYFKVFDTN